MENSGFYDYVGVAKVGLKQGVMRSAIKYKLGNYIYGVIQVWLFHVILILRSRITCLLKVYKNIFIVLGIKIGFLL